MQKTLTVQWITVLNKKNNDKNNYTACSWVKFCVTQMLQIIVYNKFTKKNNKYTAR